MSISVNNITIDVEPGASGEFVAARELLRQRAVVVGLLAAEAHDGASGRRGCRGPARRGKSLLPRPPRKNAVVTTKGICGNSKAMTSCTRDTFSSRSHHHVHVPELRARAEQTLNDLLREPDRFDAVARDLSNCPSGQHGGNLGQIGRGDTVPEFEKALFQLRAPGILRDLVKTRYGFHIVSVDQSIPGKTLPLEAVRERIAERLRTSVEERALRQYVSILAGQAEIAGANLQGAVTPLVQ